MSPKYFAADRKIKTDVVASVLEKNSKKKRERDADVNR